MAKPLVDDDLWAVVAPLLPPPAPRRPRHPGRMPLDDRRALTGILFVLKYGVPWAALPHELGCGCGMSCWRRLRAWQQAGVWARLHAVLLARLNAAGKIDWSRAAIDGTFARAFGGAAEAGRNPTDRGRPGVKPHVLVRGNGVTLVVDTTPANVPEVTMTVPLVDAVGPVGGRRGRPRQRPRALYDDRGYDSARHRRAVRRRGIAPHFARRRTPHGSGLGVFRWVVERTIGWLHGFRKLRFVTERGHDMQYAALNLAASVICFRMLMA